MTETGRIKVSKNLYRIIKEKNITQKELATRIGVAKETISRWANSKQNIGANSLCNLARCLGVSVKDLLKDVKVEEML